jgi:hypothetical protein
MLCQSSVLFERGGSCFMSPLPSGGAYWSNTEGKALHPLK